ncbi:hypothetical protein A6769_38670 [Nostoc punctiforme NIES-2108]|uniref:Uncharacterized protein n=3 Tax=Nostoc punctiforme TaxID=272131 RepID=B2ITD8_NOSP7|nr:hypothetical protein Npun_F2615 [Nostoc punctiforme PCC 73102]RCJ41162.1 hypothetical protein A6769_38670 [Nostoc punctiforme NIES-2108]
MSEYKLVIEFINESKDFALGFESGKVYEQMKNQIPEIEGVFGSENFEQFKLMSQAMNYSITQINNLNNSQEFPNDYLLLKFVFQQG